ncbi:hypothetical protein GCM10007971_18100 [Oceanobacillus indicireducens]|uniref:Uncharacterized protein n=1 Tax=Oceanobacillus indicireducens TaxID=1004261 RepID=A0A917XXE2_9BACI|nr:hypothetical protein GCM10007971_18100 [Oceanobacillus indicireducens]
MFSLYVFHLTPIQTKNPYPTKELDFYSILWSVLFVKLLIYFLAFITY